MSRKVRRGNAIRLSMSEIREAFDALPGSSIEFSTLKELPEMRQQSYKSRVYVYSINNDPKNLIVFKQLYPEIVYTKIERKNRIEDPLGYQTAILMEPCFRDIYPHLLGVLKKRNGYFMEYIAGDSTMELLNRTEADNLEKLTLQKYRRRIELLKDGLALNSKLIKQDKDVSSGLRLNRRNLEFEAFKLEKEIITALMTYPGMEFSKEADPNIAKRKVINHIRSKGTEKDLGKLCYDFLSLTMNGRTADQRIYIAHNDYDPIHKRGDWVLDVDEVGAGELECIDAQEWIKNPVSKPQLYLNNYIEGSKTIVDPERETLHLLDYFILRRLTTREKNPILLKDIKEEPVYTEFLEGWEKIREEGKEARAHNRRLICSFGKNGMNDYINFIKNFYLLSIRKNISKMSKIGKCNTEQIEAREGIDKELADKENKERELKMKKWQWYKNNLHNEFSFLINPDAAGIFFKNDDEARNIVGRMRTLLDFIGMQDNYAERELYKELSGQ